MSLHYEWTLSLRLRPDAPASFLDELRFHLGLVEQLPKDPELEIDWPCMVTELDDALPGGGVRSLTAQQPYSNRSVSFGLFVRAFVVDDAMYELISVVPAWLARWSLTQGWIGQAREELSLHPWLNLYVQNGHAYAAEPGGSVEPLDETAPPFTLRQTSGNA
ncbi:hypothetical protein J2S43_001398 [Catenuloplanes nepalensis]|uniref:Uncharacterized protein n=1 Tax=Catenuloplanes nepalensis TaxID=587533 RepID=A0ABT9MNH9_9ACTN|nr:hypothetical protein [Catenuloplanes nepalensis]MDP9792886.1 hypothetical protein [Catenuloplanes nepalensis]